MLCQIAVALALVAAASSPTQQRGPVQLIPAPKYLVGTNAGTAGAAAEKPKIDGTEFGAITIERKVYRHDVIIRLDGKVEKRKKRLSSQVYNTSHIISLDEAKHVYQEGAQRLILGSGQSGLVKLSDQAAEYFKQKGCAVELAPTPAAIRAWNAAKGAVIGLFHITC